eukprot:gene636-10340_t
MKGTRLSIRIILMIFAICCCAVDGKEEQQNGCYREYSWNYGTIKLLRYPIMYPTNLSCQYVIKVPKDKTVRVRFKDLDLVPRGLKNGMEDISVLIKNNAEWMKIEKSLYENVYGEGICVDARDISIRFKRDKLKKSRRLEVIYRISDIKCDGTKHRQTEGESIFVDASLHEKSNSVGLRVTDVNENVPRYNLKGSSQTLLEFFKGDDTAESKIILKSVGISPTAHQKSFDFSHRTINQHVRERDSVRQMSDIKSHIAESLWPLRELKTNAATLHDLAEDKQLEEVSRKRSGVEEHNSWTSILSPSVFSDQIDSTISTATVKTPGLAQEANLQSTLNMEDHMINFYSMHSGQAQQAGSTRYPFIETSFTDSDSQTAFQGFSRSKKMPPSDENTIHSRLESKSLHKVHYSGDDQSITTKIESSLISENGIGKQDLTVQSKLQSSIVDRTGLSNFRDQTENPGAIVTVNSEQQSILTQKMFTLKPTVSWEINNVPNSEEIDELTNSEYKTETDAMELLMKGKSSVPSLDSAEQLVTVHLPKVFETVLSSHIPEIASMSLPFKSQGHFASSTELSPSSIHIENLKQWVMSRQLSSLSPLRPTTVSVKRFRTITTSKRLLLSRKNELKRSLTKAASSTVLPTSIFLERSPLFLEQGFMKRTKNKNLSKNSFKLKTPVLVGKSLKEIHSSAAGFERILVAHSSVAPLYDTLRPSSSIVSRPSKQTHKNSKDFHTMGSLSVSTKLFLSASKLPELFPSLKKHRINTVDQLRQIENVQPTTRTLQIIVPFTSSKPIQKSSSTQLMHTDFGGLKPRKDRFFFFSKSAIPSSANQLGTQSVFKQPQETTSKDLGGSFNTLRSLKITQAVNVGQTGIYKVPFESISVSLLMTQSPFLQNSYPISAFSSKLSASLSSTQTYMSVTESNIARPHESKPTQQTKHLCSEHFIKNIDILEEDDPLTFEIISLSSCPRNARVRSRLASCGSAVSKVSQ